jgi:hypothetical protein
MPPIPAGHVQMVFRHTLVGDLEEMVTTCGAYIGIPTQADVNAISQSWSDNIVSLMNTDYDYIGVRVLHGQDGADPTLWESETGAKNGDAAGLCLPQNCAILIRKLPVVAARRNRGRMFIPGVPEGDVDNKGVVNLSDRTAWTAGALAFQADVAALDAAGQLEVFHSGPPFAPAAVGALVCDTRIATQRRRLRP